MSTQPTFNAKIMDLPIMKTIGEGQITKSVTNFRRGEKPMYNIIRYGAYGVAGYLAWTFLLPILTPVVAGTLGLAFMLVQLALTAIVCVVLYLLAPAIFAWARIGARFLHKTAIKYKPFEQLERERQKMIANQTTFRIANQNIKNLTQDMGLNADNCRKELEVSDRNIEILKGTVEQLKASMDEMVQNMGQAAKTEDAYVNLAVKFNKKAGDLKRAYKQAENSKDYMFKYKARESVMKKMSQKLAMVEGAMEDKIADFDQTVKFLKDDYEFAQKSNAATYAAKSAIGFSNGWERDYALEVIAESISNDTAMTYGNLRDIEALTSNYDLNSDELYNNLSLLADKFDFNDIDAQLKAYESPEYVPTATDRKNVGGWGEMFH